MAVIEGLLKVLGARHIDEHENEEAERVKSAFLPPFIHRRKLPESWAARILVRKRIARNNHDAITQLKEIASEGGILCNAAGYLAVDRGPDGTYDFHYRTPTEEERKIGRNGYKQD